ncbi:MAG: AAA family ATPase [Bacteroidales bacterium]|nr:AAA family ATPase [Bacteroidales bacterium]
MLYKYIIHKIKENFPFEPTKDQFNVIELVSRFILSKETNEILLIKGYAGTGKTSLIATIIKVLQELKQQTVLLAPTGRAAKVFSYYAKHSAFTIHKEIYRQKIQTNFQTDFSLDKNLRKQTLFFVDEASMISNQRFSDSLFGSQRLLDDLITYVYSSDCRLILLGDTAQLPPVGEVLSPALDKDYLASYGLTVHEYSLTEVVRQVKDSGILVNATAIRNQIQTEDFL